MWLVAKDIEHYDVSKHSPVSPICRICRTRQGLVCEITCEVSYLLVSIYLIATDSRQDCVEL